MKKLMIIVILTAVAAAWTAPAWAKRERVQLVCPQCNGKGNMGSHGAVIGSGVYTRVIRETSPCSHCKGTGYIWDYRDVYDQHEEELKQEEQQRNEQIDRHIREESARRRRLQEEEREEDEQLRREYDRRETERNKRENAPCPLGGYGGDGYGGKSERIYMGGGEYEDTVTKKRYDRYGKEIKPINPSHKPLRTKEQSSSARASTVRRTCEACKGTGRTMQAGTCPTCDGKGYVENR